MARLAAAGLLSGLLLPALASAASAQGISIDFGGQDGSLTTATLQLIALITLLSLVPGLAIMITCFPFIVTVLSILRQGIGLQQSPPNMLIVTLALFLTYFVMDPVFREAWDSAIGPLTRNELPIGDALERALVPFRIFMAGRVDPDTLQTLAALRPLPEGGVPLPDAPLSLLVPMMVLSAACIFFGVDGSLTAGLAEAAATVLFGGYQ